MLVRSRQTLSARQLAVLRPSIRYNSTLTPLTSSLRPWRRRPSARLAASSERNLATALDKVLPGEEIPYEGLGSSFGSQIYNFNSALQEASNWENFSPVQAQPAFRAIPRKRIDSHATPGSFEEAIALYDACIKLGRLERASVVLKRIASFNVLSAQDLMELHNQYLAVNVAHLQAEHGQDQADHLHKWFEMEIRSHRLPMMPISLAYMLKATFLTSRGKRREKLVERYMGMLPDEAGLGELHLGDILSDQELSAITQICPSYSLAYEDSPDGAMDGHVEESTCEKPEELAKSPVQTIASPTGAVLGTPQKGMGLKTVQHALSLFSDVADGDDISRLTASERQEIQTRLERDCIDAAVERWKEEHQTLSDMGLTTAASNASLGPKIYEWHAALETRIKEEFKLFDKAAKATSKTPDEVDRCQYGPFLQQSTPRRLAAITIVTVLGALGGTACEGGNLVMTPVVHQIGRLVEDDIRTVDRDKQQAERKAAARRAKLVRKVNPVLMNPVLKVTRGKRTQAKTLAPAAQAANAPPVGLNEEAAVEMRSARRFWPPATRAKVGGVLLAAMTDVAKITVFRDDPETGTPLSQTQPAFVHGVRIKLGRKVGIITANSAVAALVRKEPRGDFLARHLPMVVEPKSWVKWDQGGYLTSSASVVRVKGGETAQIHFVKEALRRGHLRQLLKGMDVLGKTGWRINRPVFDVMLKVWNSGDKFEGIPPLHPKIQYPPEPAHDEDPNVRKKWLREMKVADNVKAGLHSERCNMNFHMEVARAFRDQTFYFPHNIDFRGRAYPMPTYLNHMGPDQIRGLLRFAKGRALGSAGLRWLKIQLANVYGFDKASLSEREAFATENLDNIYESAQNPLTGKMWWRKAEDPWQALAVCFELKAALDSPDPTQFVSYLPVHQDGTCNGLQHYAALGGDTWGAQQVNLEPGDRPADVYAAVAKLVQESVTKEAAAGSRLAKAVDGKVNRKVVKQTVMTNVYGVTFAGAKKQIQKQLDALYPTLEDETGEPVVLLSGYLAKHVFKALSTMFQGAHDIQTWLGTVGGRVCRALTLPQQELIAQEALELALDDQSQRKTKKATARARVSAEELSSLFRSTIVWTTPLKLPVAQPYRVNSAQIVSTPLQDLTICKPNRTDPVDRRKQLQGFPPNFIHSLDASHMILSALECDARGLSFAAVHDSFWTHAADVDVMNEVLRDAFIGIHSDDVIARLAEEFKLRHKGSIWLGKIPAGCEAAKKITQFRKKETQHSIRDELVKEHERRGLLASSDPAERAKGRAMVTPTSIVEDVAGIDAIETLLALDDSESAETREAGDADDAMDTAAEEPDAEAAMSEPSLLDKPAGSSPPRVSFLDKLAGDSKPKPKAPPSSISVWLPLTFPPIPAKGDFDVRRLKNSKYFFS